MALMTPVVVFMGKDRSGYRHGKRDIIFRRLFGERLARQAYREEKGTGSDSPIEPEPEHAVEIITLSSACCARSSVMLNFRSRIRARDY